MTTRFILLTGAPDSRSLDWTDYIDRERIHDDYDENHNDYYDHDDNLSAEADLHTVIKTASPSPNTRPLAVWRHLPAKREHLSTGYSQQRGVTGLAQSIVTNLARSSVSDDDDDDVASPSNENKVLSSSMVHKPTAPSPVPNLAPLPRIPTHNLSALRYHPHQSSHRKSPPVDIIVGILSLSPLRTVRTRKGGTSTRLVEMTVGDETLSGFRLTVWLGPEPPASALTAGKKDPALSPLKGLRPRDIVHVSGVVALRTYADALCGSLSSAAGVRLVFRPDAQDALHPRSPPDVTRTLQTDLQAAKVKDLQADKVRRVWEWLEEFVPRGLDRGRHEVVVLAADAAAAAGTAGQIWMSDEVLPLDSQ
ncbi:MAG: hypothetical protein M1825_002538 [Sarcosagium campestre]|nr:MAG: hypothetical protein M1825_002538 [Sarcosagium campestre]